MPCLEALREHDLASDTIIVLSGLDRSRAQRHADCIRAVLGEADIIRSPTPGANRARNAALDHADPSHVLSFLDDDAVIGTSWRTAMERAWAGADASVAVIGGPIRPRFLAPRPSWMSDFTLAGLSILDRGGIATTLDAGTGFLYSANMSVRVAAARSVGGFDPGLGPAGAGPAFGDDIDIQRRLVLEGHVVRYEPDAWVEHLIGPERLTRSSMLDRRYKTGIDFGRAPTHGLARIARGVATSAARAAGAGLRGREARAMDHLSYSAQCLGELRQRIRPRG